MYCLRAKAKASKEMLRILSDMLLLQSQDKQFLLKSFGKCANKRKLHLLLNYRYPYTIAVNIFLLSDASVPNEINLAQDIGFAEQNCKNEEVLLSRRRNLPSTSFEER